MRIPFLILSFLISIQTLHALGVVQTEEHLFVYAESDQEAYFVLPLRVKPFLQVSDVIMGIEFNLGSFQRFEITKNLTSNRLTITEIEEQDTRVVVNGSLYTGETRLSDYTMELHSRHDGIQLDISLKNNASNLLNINILSNTNELVFGGGVQGSIYNLRGHTIPFIVEENGIGRGDLPLSIFTSLYGVQGHDFSNYCPTPFFITSENRSLFVNTQAPFWLDLTGEDISIDLYDVKGKLIINKANSPLELQKQLHEEIENDYSLPIWAYRSIVGLQGGRNRVDSILARFEDYDYAPGAIWIQDWVGKRQTFIGSRLNWDWQYEAKTYPEITEWIENLHKKDIRVLSYINPYMVADGDLCKEALQQNFVIRNNNGQPYQFDAGGFDAYMIDLFNPEARSWYKNIIRNMVELGFDGWMADFGEWLPPDADTEEGKAILFHNAYADEWIALNHEVRMEFRREKELFIFNRAGFSEMHESAQSIWTGDQMVNFGKKDGLRSALIGILSGASTGLPNVHSDIGGYTSLKRGPLKYLRKRELLYRWIEMNAFTMVFRSHEGLLPEDNL